MNDEGAGKRMRLSLISHPIGCMEPQQSTFPSFVTDDAVCFPLHGRVGELSEAITEIAVLLASISRGWVLESILEMVMALLVTHAHQTYFQDRFDLARTSPRFTPQTTTLRKSGT